MVVSAKHKQSPLKKSREHYQPRDIVRCGEKTLPHISWLLTVGAIGPGSKGHPSISSARCDECSYRWCCWWGPRGPRWAPKWPSRRAPSSARRCPLGRATKSSPSRASPTQHPPSDSSDSWLVFCLLTWETRAILSRSRFYRCLQMRKQVQKSSFHKKIAPYE